MVWVWKVTHSAMLFWNMLTNNDEDSGGGSGNDTIYCLFVFFFLMFLSPDLTLLMHKQITCMRILYTHSASHEINARIRLTTSNTAKTCEWWDFSTWWNSWHNKSLCERRRERKKTQENKNKRRRNTTPTGKRHQKVAGENRPRCLEAPEPVTILFASKNVTKVIYIIKWHKSVHKHRLLSPPPPPPIATQHIFLCCKDIDANLIGRQ